MGKTYSYGDLRKQQVWQFIEVLHRRAIAESRGEKPIENCHIQRFHWSEDRAHPGVKQPRLQVTTKLEAIRNLTEPRLTKDVVRQIHNYYLPHFLKILVDDRSVKQGKGAEIWRFSLWLWHIDLQKNYVQFDLMWSRQKAGPSPTITKPLISPERADDKIDRSTKVEILESSLPLNSSRYVERIEVEKQCYNCLLQPGALLRLKAPQRMGKTLLISTILSRLKKQQDYRAITVSFKLLDSINSVTLDRLLQWMCANAAQQLELSVQLKKYWNEEIFGSKVSCTEYFEKYLLDREETPLVLCLDDVDLLFHYPQIYNDFFSLLRSWYERSKIYPVWQKLRLAIVYSTDIYMSLNIHESPFNVGVVVELKEFTSEQVKQLARYYELNWSDVEVGQLMNLVGGYPELVRLAIDNLKAKPQMKLERLLQDAHTNSEIYRTHLLKKLRILQQNASISKVFKNILLDATKNQPDTSSVYLLKSIGLIKKQENCFRTSCLLYALYFKERLDEF